MTAIIIILWLLVSSPLLLIAVNPWDLPVFPTAPFSAYPTHAKSTRNSTTSPTNSFGPYNKKIPRFLWIAVRDAKEKAPPFLSYQLGPLFDRNPDWEVHMNDFNDEDEFMNTVFAGTSLLWAYNAIGVRAGVAKADIWRYAVLWAYGGVYLDDDSDLGTPLDNIIDPDDTLIVSYEKNGFNADTCYVPRFHLSDFRTKKRYGHSFAMDVKGAKPVEIFYTRILLNWAILSAPRHPVIIRTIENLVEIIRSDYLQETLLRYLKLDYRWRLVMCSTGPSVLTASAREAVLEQMYIGKTGLDSKGKGNTSLLMTVDLMDEVLGRLPISRLPLAPFTYKLAATDFKDYGGRFKAVSNRPRDNPHHYMNMHKDKVLPARPGETPRREVGLLHSYYNESPYDARVLGFLHTHRIPVQGQNGKEIFVIQDGKKRGIPNWDTFVGLNLTMADVHVSSDYKIDKIPLGAPMSLSE